MKNFHHILSAAAALLLSVGCSKLDLGRQSNVTVDEELTRAGLETATGTIPVLFVTTSDGKGITEKSVWKSAGVSMYDPSGEWDMDATGVLVKGRGNSSWTFPKKPFNLKFDDPVGIMDMRGSSRWCVLANWRDITLIRNAVALEMAKKTSLAWTPEGRFVDVVVDGKLQGNYYLTEKVEIAEDRVDVGTDGYLICIDSYYDETFRFKTKRKSLPVNILPAQGSTLDQTAFDEIRSYMDAVEEALYKGGDWRSLIDEQSFCDWLIVHELTGNDEPVRPHSVFMHKTSNGLLTAGPCWDFDCRTFIPGKKGLVNKNAVWFDALLADKGFAGLLKERWEALKPIYAALIPEYIDATYEMIAASSETDHDLWPINNPLIFLNGDEKLSPAEAVAKLKAAFTERMGTLDQAIAAL